MSTNYEPGTVAVATVQGAPGVRVFRRESDWAYCPDPDRGVTYTCASDHEGLVTDVRPLVVLDLVEPESTVRGLHAATKALRSAHPHDLGLRSALNLVADQIEVQTKLPKPVEPTARGAVVKDAAGLEWVRIHPGGEAWVNGYQRWAHYDDINAVEVVRP